METTNIVDAPVHYNPNQLVTYKVINAGETTYPTDKVTEIEWQLENARFVNRALTELQTCKNNLEEALAGWIDNDSSAEDIVAEICQMFGFEPTKQIEFEATATITGTVTIPLADVADFNIHDIELNIDVSAYTHDIDDYNVEIDNITSL